MLQQAKVKQNNDGNKRPQQQDELPLCHQIRLASLINQFRNLAHRAMHRQVLQPHINDHAEPKPEQAEQNADHQQPVPVDSPVQKGHRRKVRKFQRGFAAGSLAARLSHSSGGADGKQRGHSKSLLQKAGCRTASFKRSSGKPGAHNDSSKMSRLSGIDKRV